MLRPQPLHQLPSLGICAHRCTRMPTLPCCTNVATWVVLLDAGSALTKGGQVMFCPRPLHQLPKLPGNVSLSLL